MPSAIVRPFYQPNSNILRAQRWCNHLWRYFDEEDNKSSSVALLGHEIPRKLPRMTLDSRQARLQKTSFSSCVMKPWLKIREDWRSSVATAHSQSGKEQTLKMPRMI